MRSLGFANVSRWHSARNAHAVLKRCFTAVLLTTGLLVLAARPATAQTLGSQERLCDPTFEDCRADILTYIQQETVEIDMGFWMITDARYSNALVAAWQRGVKIRLLMDPRCVSEHSACAAQNQQLAQAGLPMRNRDTGGILHWKCIIFAGQGQMEFAGANYAPFEMVPDQPYVNFTDEIVMYTNDSSIVHSFMRKFDDLWTSTTEFTNYANINGPLTRSYPTYTIDPDLNFPPDDSYRDRALSGYNHEQQKIDVLMFRITDESHSLAMINAVNRGVPVRLITDETEYRNPNRLWDAYNVDEMYQAGVQVRLDGHQGIDHAKGVILYGTGMAIYGSSNWTSPSSDSQREHNLFTTKPWILTWLTNLFERKWNNSTGNIETKTFVPLPPDAPKYNLPADGATNVPVTGTSLSWNAGLWAHNYDIYFGTSPNPPLIETNKKLGPSQYDTDYKTYALPQLLPGTKYYWKIVSKTMAFVTADGPIRSFTTAGSAPNDIPPTVSLTSPASGATFDAGTAIGLAATASDSDGTVTKVDFYAGNTLVGTDTSSPYSVTWNSAAPGSYNLTAIATDNDGATTTSGIVSITVNSGPSTLPSGWSDSDIGAVGAAGSAAFANGVFTVRGSGADVWGTADALHYAYMPFSGNGWMIARVATISSDASWVKAGVMIRGSLSPSSAQGFMLVSWSKGVAYQRRLADGNASVSTAGSTSTAPRWVKIERVGNIINAYESPDGTTWTLVGSDTFTMGASALIGLGVSSHVAGTVATATFDHVTTSVTAPANTPPAVSLTGPANNATFTAPATIALTASASDSDGTVTKVDFYSGTTLLGTDTTSPYAFSWTNVPAGSYTLKAVATDNGGATTTSTPVTITVTAAQGGGLPAGWSDADVGAVPIAGSATYASGSGTFTVTGSGADVWGTADAFHYAYTSMTGDGTIIARVASIPTTVNAWVKAGVMIRQDLSAGSAQAFMLVSASKGVAFQRREVANNASVSTAGSLSAAPRWVKLTRQGSTISAYESPDGTAWTLVGTDTISMSSTVFVGLAVTSHTTSASATCTLDHITIQ
jgi:phosphatidylserine/phosphatidylglycerophosphate/cardiolipin synthase-like enzyme